MQVKNNVHTSGYLISEEIGEYNVRLVIGIIVLQKNLEVYADIPIPIWEKYKSDFPRDFFSISVSGILKTEQNDDGTLKYIIKVTPKNGSVRHFDNVLEESLNETTLFFSGPVELKEKFDFNPKSNLFLKRMVFKTVGCHSVFFEAMAFRRIAQYFESIQEGDIITLKANYTIDNNDCHLPYWKVNKPPTLIKAPT